MQSRERERGHPCLSHCVFTLCILGENESTEQQVHGVLNLIDLDGSGHLSRSGSTGECLKETQVCISSYGQTGSGKTYMVLGKPDFLEHKGLIPRSLEHIFKTIQALSSQGSSFRMQASMLDIYNETIRDLLSTTKFGGADGPRSDNGTPVKQYTIKHDQNGNSFVSNLTIVDVTNWNEVSSLLHKVSQSSYAYI